MSFTIPNFSLGLYVNLRLMIPHTILEFLPSILDKYTF